MALDDIGLGSLAMDVHFEVIVNTLQAKVEFSNILRAILRGNIPKELQGREFMRRLSEHDPDLYYPSRIADPSLNAAWNFCDCYFDALGHDFKECGGMPMDEAGRKLEGIISVFENGGEITDSDLLRFFNKPVEWRLKKTFPWVSRG